MTRLTEKQKCNGCSACRDICPTKAISMAADAEGFLYPTVDAALCIECGKCEKCCPVASGAKRAAGEPVAYAARIRDEAVRASSSSGGIFTALATAVLSSGGAVFGAAFDDHFQLTHMAITDLRDIGKLQGSKYVQSRIGTAYVQAKQWLDEDKPALFTGTPCQIAGLYAFLNRDYEKLYTQDIICHGVPTPRLWQAYRQFREEKAGSALAKVSFRCKSTGWRSCSLRMDFENGVRYEKPLSQDPYMSGFLKNLCLRPSCYHCAFKTTHRAADLTLADFWGIEKVCPELDDEKGTSLVVLHSPKAQALFEKIKPDLICREVELEQAIRYNSAMLHSVACPEQRQAYLADLEKHGFSGTVKYVRVPLIQKCKRMLKAWLKKN